MSNNSSNGTACSIRFPSVLTIVFIVLKLCGIIHWSWLWVLAPLWMPIVIVLFILLIIIIGAG